MSAFDRKLTEVERLVRNIRNARSYVSRSQLVDLLARTADEMRHASPFPENDEAPALTETAEAGET